MEDMAHGRSGSMRDMVQETYGTRKIWYVGDMVHGRYGTWRYGTGEMWYNGDMVHERYGAREILYN